MKILYEVNDKENIEKFILLLSLGLIAALEEDVLSIDESEIFLFRPWMDEMKQYGFRKKVIDIIHSCTELEDFQSILPHKLEGQIINIKKDILESLGSLNVKNHKILIGKVNLDVEE